MELPDTFRRFVSGTSRVMSGLNPQNRIIFVRYKTARTKGVRFLGNSVIGSDDKPIQESVRSILKPVLKPVLKFVVNPEAPVIGPLAPILEHMIKMNQEAHRALVRTDTDHTDDESKYEAIAESNKQYNSKSKYPEDSSERLSLAGPRKRSREYIDIGLISKMKKTKEQGDEIEEFPTTQKCGFLQGRVHRKYARSVEDDDI